MDKYLLEILKLVNTIIIPNLGALTITDTNSGDIKFMSSLKHDDGKLAIYIAKKEGWEENDAKNLISKYVREILSDLDKGEEYVMYQFGTFYKEGEDIQFKSWDTKENDTITQEVKEETKIIPIITPEKELNILEKEAKAVTTEKLNTLKKEKKEKEESEKDKKKGAGFWVGIGLLALLLGGGVFAVLNFDYLKQTLPFLADNTEISNEEDDSDNSQPEEEATDLNTETEESNPDKTEDEPILKEEDLSEPEAIDDVIEEPIIESNINTSKPYNIIAGVFSSEQNALNLVEKLKTLGHSATFKNKNGMYTVSAESFNTKEEARIRLGELKTDVPSGWISKW